MRQPLSLQAQYAQQQGAMAEFQRRQMDAKRQALSGSMTHRPQAPINAQLNANGNSGMDLLNQGFGVGPAMLAHMTNPMEYVRGLNALGQRAGNAATAGMMHAGVPDDPTELLKQYREALQSGDEETAGALKQQLKGVQQAQQDAGTGWMPPELAGAAGAGSEFAADPSNLIPGKGGATIGLKAMLAGLPMMGLGTKSAKGSAARELGSFDRSVDVPFGQYAPGGDISTRVPGTKNPIGDASAGDLTVNADEYVDLAKDRLAEVLPNYPGMRRNSVPQRPEDVINEFKEFRTENLLDIHDRIPPELRDRMSHWYDGAHRIAQDRSQRYDIPIEPTAGVYAALSPQKDWFQNVSLGDRVLDIYKNPASQSWTPEMTQYASRFNVNDPVAKSALPNVVGRDFTELNDPVEKALWIRMRDEAMNPSTYRVVSPEGDMMGLATNMKGDPMNRGWGSTNEIAKAVSMLDTPTRDNVSSLLGNAHKVRNFGMNISNPMSRRGEGTIDTHAIAAAEYSPLGGSAPQVLQNFGSGVSAKKPNFEPWMKGAGLSKPAHGYQGTYPLNLGILQDAGSERGALARQMQSMTWEGIRNLFTNKSPQMQARVRSIWDEVSEGTKTRQNARDEIVELAGGIDVPAWAR